MDFLPNPVGNTDPVLLEPEYDIQTLGIEWVEIPAGEFVMGDDEGRVYDQPAHVVHLDAYLISKYEITFDQFEPFLEFHGWNPRDDEGWGRGDRPVIHVNWTTANAFCRWLSEKTGKAIRLPTEAQWEKAARGTDQRRYPWGDEPPNETLLNFDGNVGMTMPVGSYPGGVSPFGVYDMAGNVSEWCRDYYHASYYADSPNTNPLGPEEGRTFRCLRGGSHSGAHPFMVRSSCRARNAFYRDFSDVGFRVVWEEPGDS